jgi:RNA polymerase sigma-70 factor, ECF subfamily
MIDSLLLVLVPCRCAAVCKAGAGSAARATLSLAPVSYEPENAIHLFNRPVGLDEQALIRRVLDGDASAERQLYDAHVDRVYRLAYRMAGDEELARDFTQETFIRAFDRLGAFRGEAALSTWLHSIAVSVTLNGLRKAKRFRTREADLDEAAAFDAGPRLAEPDLRARLYGAIDGLPDLYRMVFVMHDMEGYTHEEIGAALDVATGTSKARLSRARSKLREALRDFAGEWAS